MSLSNPPPPIVTVRFNEIKSPDFTPEIRRLGALGITWDVFFSEILTFSQFLEFKVLSNI
jgi:hypothetical protein